MPILYPLVRALRQGRRAGARGACHPPRVGEAEAGVAGGAFGPRCGEHTGQLVVVVVDLGSGLAVIWAEDAADVLDQAALVGDRSGEEERVQCGAVEAFPCVGAGGDYEQRQPTGAGCSRASAAARLLAPIPP